MDDDIAEGIGLEDGPRSQPRLRRADDFKSIYMGNFNISLQEHALEVSIINEKQFGAVRWAQENIGFKDTGSADFELVEEAQFLIPNDLAKQLCAVMLQSLIRKETIDDILDQEEPDESKLEEVGDLTIDPEQFESLYDSLKEDMLKDVSEK